MILDKGHIQVYTGEGKGKSTAAAGLALRMVGRGGKVFIVRFLKGRECGEDLAFLSGFGVETKHFGSIDFVIGTPSEEDILEAKRGLEFCKETLQTSEYDLLVLDEINVVVQLGLLTVTEVLEVLSIRPEHTEIVLTGRDAPPEFLKIAGLVTEMKEIKHYYHAGVSARKGIED